MITIKSMRRGWLILGLASAFSCAAIAFACGGGDNPPPLGGTGDDGGGDDRSTLKDGQKEPSDSAVTTSTTYNELTDKTKWSFFDFGTLDPAPDGAPFAGPAGFLGAVFDGKFIYY